MGCAGSAPSGGEAPPPEVPKKSASYAGQGIRTLPSSLADDLEELDLSENPDLTSVEGIGKLTSLEKLDANACGLVKLPEDIEGCVALTELLVYKNKLKELTVKLGSLASLETFNIFNNQVKKLPVEMGGLTQLEEVNAAANKLMMLTDAHFSGWASVKILSLYDNSKAAQLPLAIPHPSPLTRAAVCPLSDLVRMGSLAPLVALEELRISGNNLEAMPTLSKHPALTVYEIHKNRIGAIEPAYFDATPALQRLSVWGNALAELPPSLRTCSSLVGVQAQENKLATIPAGAWPPGLETLFLQGNGPSFTLPTELSACQKLRRVNLGSLALDSGSSGIAEAMKKLCLSDPSGIFWGSDGVRTTP